jgi:hypothetical protein
VLRHPHELDKLEIVWDMALQCMNPEVVPKAIEFLIKVYYSIDADLADQLITIQDNFISRCMDILKSTTDENVISRVIEIIRHIIIEAEKKGTSEVKPHSALLKGELLERIVIKNKASPNIS